jgi:NAD(P)-dependent dehydrogenase (short-subunit alcohol dehydrogenase family)
LLEGQVAVVTGGARGIGRAISRRLAAEGVAVVIADLAEANGESFALELAQEGGSASAVTVDVADPIQAEAAMEHAVEVYGTLDILVANAGVTGSNGPFLDISNDVWEKVLSVNLDGVFFSGRSAARVMVRRGTAGRIVNMASVNSFAAEPNGAAYVASKGGVLALTRAMAVDLAPHGIRVNAVAPGPIRHEGTAPSFDLETMRSGFARSIPLGRAGTAEEVAALTAFLASSDCGYLTGECVRLDGGYFSLLRFD